MRKVLPWLVALLALGMVFVIGCGGDDDDDDDDVVTDGAIHGTVADVAGNPLEGVVLTAAPTGGTRTTEAAGTFQFNDLDPGVYTVTAELDGYITQTQADTVVAGQVAEMDFILVEEMTGNGNITGVITDATDDSPISGATVSTIPATATATTNDNGVYTFTSIEAGTYRVTVAVANYDPRTSGEFSLSDGETEAVNLELYPSQQGTGTVSGYVGHAQNEDMLEGVTITAGDGTTATTDVDGYYSMTVDAAYMEFTATMDGYYEATRWEYVPSNGTVEVNFALSPILVGGEDYRFVLSWGEEPRDLDSHLMTPEIEGETYEIYFAARGDSAIAPYARLDRDVINGYGPETVTIFETFPGTYTYYVHNYSSGDISGCGAQLEVYDADGLVNTVIVPQTGEGEYWVVFELDGTNNVLTLVNEVRDEEPAGAIADPNTHVKNY